MALDQERSNYYLDLLRNAEASGDIAALNNIRQQYLTESGTPEAYAPIASVGQQAFQQSKPSGWDIPLEAIKAPMRGMGETIAAIPGIDVGLGEAMQSWAQPDAPTFAGELTQSWGPEWAPQDIGGVVSNLPGAAAEQTGQIAGSMASMKAGAAAGARFGRFGGARGRAIGGIIGGILGPMFWSASQVAGPTANKLAIANGRVEPDSADWAQAILTAGAVGALDRAGLGAIMNTATKGALRSVATRTAGGMAGELGTEAAQTGVEQLGSTYGTPGGVEFVPGEIASAGIIGGGAGGGASAAMAVPQEIVGAMPADQEYMRQSALAEQARLTGINPDQQRVFDTLEGAQLAAALEGRRGPTSETAGYYDPITGTSNVIVENAYRELGGKPTRKQVQKYVRDLIAEESIDHKVFLENLQDKAGFLDQFYNKRRKDIDEWLSRNSQYAEYLRRPNGHRDVAAEFISSVARAKGIDASITKSIIANVKNFLRKKEILGFEADFSNSQIYDLITKAAVQAERGTTKQAPIINKEGILESRDNVTRFPDRMREVAVERATAPNEKVRFSKQRMASIQEDWDDNELYLRREYGDFDTFEEAEWDLNYEVWLDELSGAVLESRGPKDPSRRKFLKQVGGAAAGIAADPRMILEPATRLVPGDPFVQQLADVVVPDIDTIYKFDIAVDPNAGWTSSDDPGERSMEVTFHYDANQELIEVYEGEELVDTINIAENQEDVDSLIIQYVNDEYGRKNVNSVHDPIRDPEGEGGDDGGPLSESEMDAFFNDANTSYKQQAQNMVAGQLKRKMESGQRESFAQMVEEGTVRVPDRAITQQTWRRPAVELTTQRGPAYDYFDEPTTPRLPERETPRLPEPKALAIERPTQKALPAPKETTEKTDAELYVDTIDEIMNIYDEDATAAEAAQDGTLDYRITSYAANTPFTREELWDGVNQRIEALEEPGILESRARMPKKDTVVRDISNRMSKKIRPEIAAMDISESEKVALLDLAARLRAVMGKAARKRGIDAGDFDVFVEQSQNILDGNLEAVEKFIAPFAAQMTGTKERVRKAEARRDQRARRIGKTDAEILKYRPKGAKHPMEGKMTYPFAQEEINRLEKAGDITPEEAEIRRLAVNNVRRIFQGKAGPTVKRTITEAVYGIGAYEDLVPWAEVYTEEQATDMGERAEVAQAEATRTRYDATDITNKQKQALLKAPPTADELLWVESGATPSLKGKRARLLFLRAPAEFKNESERAELARFREKLAKKETYTESKPADPEALIEELKKEGRYTRLAPGPITRYKESKSRVENWEVARMNRMLSDDVEDTTEIAGVEYDSQGEAIDPSWYQLTDEDGNAVETPEGILERKKEELYQSDLDPEGGVLMTGGVQLVPVKYKGITYWTSLNDFAELTKVRPTDAWRYQRESIINISKEWRALRINSDRKAKDEKIKRVIEKVIIPQLSKETGIQHSADHMVPLRGYGLDFAWNMFPLPKSWNESLKDRSIHDSENKQIQKFTKYLKKHAEDSKKSTTQIYLEALKASGAWTPSESIEDIAKRIKPFPEPEIAPAAMKQLAGIPRILTAYGYVHPQVERAKKDGEELPFIPQGAKLEDWEKVVFETYNLERLRKPPKERDYTEHFNDGFWYNITSFLWGKPVQAIRDFNKVTRFGTSQGNITAADQIADLIQRAHVSGRRAGGLETGSDLVQDVSMRSGEFYSTLSKIFARVTGRDGVIDDATNREIIDYLIDRPVTFSSKKIESAAKELKTLITRIDTYAAEETAGLKKPLNLRGAGDTHVPRVWNIEYLATRQGKAKFLRAISSVFTPHGGKSTIFEEAGITVEDLYNAVINSGGFVQGDWTNIVADQLRSEEDIKKDNLIQEYLDSLPTEALMDERLVLDDLQALMPRFVQKAVERTEYSKRFGSNDELLRAMIKEGVAQIRAHNKEVLKLKKTDSPMPWMSEKRFEKAVWDMARILRNQYGYDVANMATRKWLQRISNTQVLFKLPLVTLASMPEFFTPMLRGDVSPHHWFMDFMAGTAWAGYKAANGLSKLIFNQHLPAMRKYSKDIGGAGIISDIQLLRELGIADIQAMGDLVATRYSNPNFARGGLRAGARGGITGKIPKRVRAVFNMQVFMQATMLVTMTEMQQLMALRNFQRHTGRRIKFVQKHSGKSLSGRRARLYKQFKQDLLDYGITEDIDLSTASGQAAFNAGALRFIDQVITRPNDATTAKAFKNPLIAPLVLFKRFITTFGNTLMTAIGNDMATKVDNVERAKQVGRVAATAMTMYGAVMFAEILRGVIRGDLDDEDLEVIPGDYKQFVRRLDRTGLLSAPGTALVNLTFPYKRGWWDSTQSRIFGEILGPIGGDASAFGDALLSDKDNAWLRLLSQTLPLSKQVMGPTLSSGGSSSRSRRRRKRRRRRRKRD